MLSMAACPETKRKILNCWAYRMKTNPDWSIDRYKACLVFKGCMQTADINYGDTFIPVCWYGTIWALIAMATRENLKLFQIDMETAFLYGDLI